MRVDVRPAASRFETRTDWLVSRHSFSYGPHYDPDNTSFGVLLASNDDELAPGGGFGDHPHRGVEIVTWVTEGALRHTDDLGSDQVVSPGMLQRLSAGSGVRHSEVNATGSVARYVQMWVVDDDQARPDYAVAEAPASRGAFVALASGSAPAPLRLRQAAATLLVAQIAVGGAATLRGGRFTHLFVTRGSITAGPASLAEGDAARISDAGDLVVRADAGTGAQVLAWVMDAQAWRPPAR